VHNNWLYVSIFKLNYDHKATYLQVITSLA